MHQILFRLGLSQIFGSASAPDHAGVALLQHPRPETPAGFKGAYASRGGRAGAFSYVVHSGKRIFDATDDATHVSLLGPKYSCPRVWFLADRTNGSVYARLQCRVRLSVVCDVMYNVLWLNGVS